MKTSAAMVRPVLMEERVLTPLEVTVVVAVVQDTREQRVLQVRYMFYLTLNEMKLEQQSMVHHRKYPLFYL